MKVSTKLRAYGQVGYTLLLVTMTGCATIRQSYPERNFYSLEPERTPEAAVQAGSVTLLVRPFTVSPQFEGKGFVYRLADLTYETDYYNQFIVPPGSLFTDAVREWLSRSGRFRRVTNSFSYAEPTHILEGHITALYGDMSDKAQPKAVLEMKCFLLAVGSPEPGFVFQNTYRKEVAIGESSPRALAEGWNDALEQILVSFEEELGEIEFERS